MPRAVPRLQDAGAAAHCVALDSIKQRLNGGVDGFQLAGTYRVNGEGSVRLGLFRKLDGLNKLDVGTISARL